MANIILNNYCNLDCPYCFADKHIKETDKENINLEQLEKIINFIGADKRVGLIGGEPTLHPQIGEILNYLNNKFKNTDNKWVIFTNGIELYKIIKYFNTNHGMCLININHPDVVGKEKWKNIIKSLSLFKQNNLLGCVTIGINLYPDLKSFDYIFNIAKFFDIKNIRVSYVAPTKQYEVDNKDIYYLNGKEQFLNFCKQAKELNISIGLDCNKIPICYFSEEEKILVKEVCREINTFCNPVLDITPDFKAASCFGTYNLIDLSNFKDVEEVNRYFLFNKYYHLTQINRSFGKCKDCDDLICQGGCLAFAKNLEI